MFKVKKHGYEFIVIKLKCPSEMIQCLNEIENHRNIHDEISLLISTKKKKYFKYPIILCEFLSHL